MNEQSDSVWRAGRAAYLAGLKSADDNPYKFGEVILRSVWLKGFENLPISDLERLAKLKSDLGYAVGDDDASAE